MNIPPIIPKHDGAARRRGPFFWKPKATTSNREIPFETAKIATNAQSTLSNYSKFKEFSCP